MSSYMYFGLMNLRSNKLCVERAAPINVDTLVLTLTRRGRH